jgi:hypothetical protein
MSLRNLGDKSLKTSGYGMLSRDIMEGMRDLA